MKIYYTYGTWIGVLSLSNVKKGEEAGLIGWLKSKHKNLKIIEIRY